MTEEEKFTHTADDIGPGPELPPLPDDTDEGEFRGRRDCNYISADGWHEVFAGVGGRNRCFCSFCVALRAANPRPAIIPF